MNIFSYVRSAFRNCVFVSVLFSGVSFADSANKGIQYEFDFNPNIKMALHASFDFQGVTYSSDAPVGYKGIAGAPSGTNTIFNSAGSLSTEVSYVVEGLKLGAKVGMGVAVRDARRYPSSLFLENPWGRIEFGNEKSSEAALKVHGNTVAAGTGAWDSYARLDPQFSKNDVVSYVVSFVGFLDQKMRTGHLALNSGSIAAMYTDYSRKITYYTPDIKGWKFGVSYILDSVNTGENKFMLYKTASDINSYTDNVSHASGGAHNPINTASLFKLEVKNGMTFGAKYENKINNDWSYKVGFTFEHGEVKAFRASSGAVVSDVKFANLSHPTIGFAVTYKNWSFSTAYSDYMKSFTPSTYYNRNSTLYNCGLRYISDDKKKTLSATYFHSNNWGNPLDTVVVALDYKVAKGFVTYIEAAKFSARGTNAIKNLDTSSTTSNPTMTKVSGRKTAGYLILSGVKVMI